MVKGLGDIWGRAQGYSPSSGESNGKEHGI